MNWGYKIILTMLVFVAFIMSMVFYMVSSKTDLVQDDYYEQDLRYNEIQQQRGNAAKLAQPVRWQKTLQGGQVVFPTDFAAADISGQIKFARVSDAKLDFTVPVSLDSARSQTIDLSRFPMGLWRVTVEWQAKGTPYLSELTVQ